MDNEVDILLIDDELHPYYGYDNDFEALKELELRFLKSYLENKDRMSAETWLAQELNDVLPEMEKHEIDEICLEITQTVQTNDEKQKHLKSVINQGRSKEGWLAGEAKKAVAHLSDKQAAEYLVNLDQVIKGANDEMARTIFTQSGKVNLNPNLDGFIAEQYHANTFNMNAASSGSPYRAEVLQPKPGQTYKKNSVDIVIKDGQGKTVRRYQSKYCSDAKSTSSSFENGNYRGQRRLAPEGQSEAVKKSCAQLEAPDGTVSNTLSKQQAKSLQRDAQSGQSINHSWNEFQLKQLAAGIGKEAGVAALQSAAIGTGIDLAVKLYRGEEIKHQEILENALKTGADTGVKVALAGALKVAVEKGAVKMIPKGTPVSTLTSIVTVGVENIKVIKKVSDGELTLLEGLNEMEVTTVSTIAGILASTEGMVTGAAIGSVFGPPGTLVGGFIGGIVGYATGSKVAEQLTRAHQKLRTTAAETFERSWSNVRNTASTVWQNAKSIGRWLWA
ncbi:MULTISPECIES: hypothetical protein [unclassified Paenibacillus]|uniref:hypothetical protein n=1 Tax=unclassified Paenibacillus TaxID=185978 RepID=UPI002404BF59|nr:MULTISPECIES: hypothetical protein [unclassified Paenibacillus]MDF9840777.1 hypothetical protein [Paenibacillus sp. PastF-2]MDF9847360.1 hypothetical protein [Paenibacillus sp. PastM-2]MDF9854062.1 hypothetical protein [Paenibacillus sp. PastF-1]MDH6479335.1 hypothetical protein [Paenibacillus sp. PastH-2]MDH6506932.1 hypothetical protein [Paenibacillus sp. PastM-3]